MIEPVCVVNNSANNGCSTFMATCASCGEPRFRLARSAKQIAKDCPACAREKRKTHKMSGTRLYTAWHNMISRTKGQVGPRFKKMYEGVKVCEEWKKFEPFRDWALANGYDDTKTLDRERGDGHYEPGNARWVNTLTQSRNRSNIKLSKECADVIREMYSTGDYTQKQLAKMFNITPASANAILLYKTWKV
jgi:hypothetical protein